METKTIKRALSEKDIEKIVGYKPRNEDEMMAKSVFLFSFYTMGMNFVDIAHLKWSDVFDERIHYNRKKTDEDFSIKILPTVKEMISNFSSFKNELDYVFPILSEKQKTEKCLSVNFTDTIFLNLVRSNFDMICVNKFKSFIYILRTLLEVNVYLRPNTKIMPYRIILLFIVMFFLVKVQGQQIPQNFQGKTHMLNEQEMLRLNEVEEAFETTTPPDGNIRSIAEFERMEGVIVTFLSYSTSGGYLGIPIELIAEISEDALVYTIVEDSSALNYINNSYIQNDVVIGNVIYVLAEANSYWARDYSPWFISNDDTVSIVNFPYNRPRLDDDEMPKVFGDFFDMKVFGMDLMSTGGNYMSDGQGVAASCDLVYTENPLLKHDEVCAFANDYLGVSKYHLLDDPLDDYIEHIDCWGKFLAVDKILIGKVSRTDYRYTDYELLADYWATQTSSYGNKYKVFRVYSPNGQPYTNSLILNNKVLVPIVTGLGSDYNEQALEVYRSAMPGYEVIGIAQDPLHIWQSTDALHCRVHEVPDREMLYINHIPLTDTLPKEDSVVVFKMEVHSYGGHSIDSIALNYSINDSIYSPIELSIDSMYWYSCTLEATPGDIIQYYLVAKDSTGRTEMHPFMGALDPNSFVIEAHPEYINSNDTTVSIPALAQNEFQLKVYPNPTSGKLSIALIDFPNQEVFIRIKDVHGRLIVDYHYKNVSPWFNKSYNLSHLNSGLYILEISSGSICVSEKIMVY